MKTKQKKVTALVDRFGSNRMNAERPGHFFQGCTCVSIPFAGVMCEVAHMTANIINVNDLDRHVINLGRVVRDRGAELRDKLEVTEFHTDQLKESQEYCRIIEQDPAPDFDGAGTFHDGQTFVAPDSFYWAYHYFVCSWMTRGGKMGTKGEFDQGLSVRWKSTGGDSVVRFRSATEALKDWQQVMHRCTFHTLDAFTFIAECKKRDIRQNGIFCDPPWPDDGANYTHRFTEKMHVDLAMRLAEFKETRVVVRFGDHSLIREIYPTSHWTWHEVTGRTQANDDKAEVLLTNWRP